MAAGTCVIRLFVAVLCFSYLICNSVAVPFTRISRNLEQKPPTYQVALDNSEKSWKVLDGTVRRMEIEVNDYPGSGANNRHTPRP